MPKGVSATYQSRTRRILYLQRRLAFEHEGGGRWTEGQGSEAFGPLRRGW
jgi:hypothetical protein